MYNEIEDTLLGCTLSYKTALVILLGVPSLIKLLVELLDVPSYKIALVKLLGVPSYKITFIKLLCVPSFNVKVYGTHPLRVYYAW